MQNMNGSAQEEKWWLYPIFFLIGLLSFPFSLFMGAILGSANILILEGIFQLLFPFVICSILFATVLYTFKERSFRFALKVFAISLVASISIFMGGSFGLGLLIPLGLFLPLYPLVFLFILFAVGWIAFKNHPMAKFALKGFTISFFTIFLIVGAWFMWGAIEHEYAKYIDIHKVDGMTGEYVNITEEELREYPALKKAISGEGEECTKFSEDSWSCKVHPDDWRPMLEFFEKKRYEAALLFSVEGLELEEGENKISNVPKRLRDVFGSKGILLSEYALLYQPTLGRWRVFERQYLFSIINAELERELNQIRESEEGRIAKLKDVFESKGIPLTEKPRVLRMQENWIVVHEAVPTSYEIWREDGKLNVYTERKWVYEIWREEGKLNVYKSTVIDRPVVIKVGESYYEVGFAQA